MADQWRVLTMPYNVTGILLSETYIVDSMGYIMADSLGYSVAGDSIRESIIYKAGVQTWVVTSNWFQLDHELGANRSFSNIYGRSLFLRSYYSRLKKGPVTLTMPRVMKALKPLQFPKTTACGETTILSSMKPPTLCSLQEKHNSSGGYPKWAKTASLCTGAGLTHSSSRKIVPMEDTATTGMASISFLKVRAATPSAPKRLYPKIPAPKHSPSLATTLSKSIRSRASLSGSGTMSNSSFC